MSSLNLSFKGIADKVNKLDSKQDFNLQNIDIEKIALNKDNFYGMRDIEELAEDIKTNGLYHNLVVVQDGDKYKIVSGERRYRALKSLGYKKVPCQVRDNLSDIDGEIMLIQANAKARELTHAEKMKQIERLEELYKEKRKNGEKLEGKTRDIIGKDLNLSGSQVGKYQKINKDLIPELKEMLEQNNLDMEKAASIAALEIEGQITIYEMLKGNVELGRDQINKLKKALKEKEEQFKREKEINEEKLAKEYEKIKKIREEFNQDYEKSIREKETQKDSTSNKGARSEHLENEKIDMENIEFNAEINIAIRNLREASNLLLRKILMGKENKKILSDKNIKDIEELKKYQLKNVFDLKR